MWLGQPQKGSASSPFTSRILQWNGSERRKRVKEIPLSNSDKYAIVDDSDYELVSKYNWHLNGPGYPETTIKGKTVFLHTLIMGKVEGKEVDHIDSNKFNCQRINLRHCTHSQNIANDGPKSNNKLSVKGVDFYNGRYRATIRKDYKKIHIGIFDTLREAAEAWNAVARSYFGEFAYQNNLEEL